MTVRKDKLIAGYNGNLESVIVYDAEGTNPIAVENGVWVVVEGLIKGEREVKKARLAKAEDADKTLHFIHNPEVMADERQWKLSQFKQEAGKVSRAYSIAKGDVLTLTADLFAGVVAVGDKLSIEKDGKIGKPSLDETATNAMNSFEVIEACGYEIDNEQVAYAVQVIK